MSTNFQPRPQAELFAALDGRSFEHTRGGRTDIYTIRIEGGAHTVHDRLRGANAVGHQRAVAERPGCLFDLATEPALFIRLCNELAGGYYKS